MTQTKGLVAQSATDLSLARVCRIPVSASAALVDAPSPALRGPFDLMADDGSRPEPPAPECDDLAALFLPVAAGEEEPWVDARRLHQALGVGKAFRAWIAGRIESSGFVEGTDFVSFDGLSAPNLGSPKSRPQKTKDYWLTMDTAKHLAMLERNAQGAAVRRYFRECEKQLWQRQFVVKAEVGCAQAG